MTNQDNQSNEEYPITQGSGTVHPPAASPPPPKSQKPVVLFVLLALVLLLATSLAVIGIRNKKPVKDQSQTPSVQEQPKEVIQSGGAVSISNDGFIPATIKIKSGQSVTWTNTDDQPHQPATDPYPAQDGLEGFKSEEPIAKNEAYSFTFEKAGTYTYHDNLNPLKFKGTVVVE